MKMPAESVEEIVPLLLMSPVNVRTSTTTRPVRHAEMLPLLVTLPVKVETGPIKMPTEPAVIVPLLATLPEKFETPAEGDVNCPRRYQPHQAHSLR